ncbi:hypothetical protein EVAR_28665_1 [Eumeta japonica]|uniref:Uncharacterized protein n=1 Tax=Eumeta variegata TaxID=151549 RepID=A0A4C1V4S6_EUMVA|nr:hypothetical protein EVAR_28665_1 [Eumeta japonica]
MVGNECADKLARNADLTKKTKADYDGYSINCAIRVIKAASREEWQERYTEGSIVSRALQSSLVLLEPIGSRSHRSSRNTSAPGLQSRPTEYNEPGAPTPVQRTYKPEEGMELEALYRRYCVRLKHSLFVAALAVTFAACATLLVAVCTLHAHVSTTLHESLRALNRYDICITHFTPHRRVRLCSKKRVLDRGPPAHSMRLEDSGDNLPISMLPFTVDEATNYGHILNVNYKKSQWHCAHRFTIACTITNAKNVILDFLGQIQVRAYVRAEGSVPNI